MNIVSHTPGPGCEHCRRMNEIAAGIIDRIVCQGRDAGLTTVDITTMSASIAVAMAQTLELSKQDFDELTAICWGGTTSDKADPAAEDLAAVANSKWGRA